MKKLTLEQLTSGIKDRNVGAERARLVEKWSKTGLLRGLEGYRRESMAQLLENQAHQILRESNAISTGAASGVSSGQLAGFSSVAFPLVRRVFAGLVANELVSVQPMSLPSGLIFYLDFTYGNNVGGTAGLGLSNSATEATYQRGQSIYSNPTGKGIQSGSLAAGGAYDLVGTGYTKVHSGTSDFNLVGAAIGAWNTVGDVWLTGSTVGTSMSGTNARFMSFDPQVDADLAAGTLDATFLHVPVSTIVAAHPRVDLTAVDQIALTALPTANNATTWGTSYQSGVSVYNLRRLNKRGTWSAGVFTPDAQNGSHVQMVLRLTDGGAVPAFGAATSHLSVALADNLVVDGGSGSTLTVPSFETDFGSSPLASIPEIDMKIESIAITATTRKLRARWAPELAQDLNAYHSLDAEVELTNVLSQQVALEIDREILLDLVTQANGANYYWSRAPGKFVNKVTGQAQTLASTTAIGPNFTGTVQDWYQTLIETIIDVANTIHRKTLRAAANFCVVGPDVATIMESTLLYKSKISIDGDGQVATPHTIGCEAIGTVSNRFTVYKDPFFPRNKVLVGYKGGSPLDCGFVYAPYVPLLVTPVIYRPEDFAPTRGVMTRYAKKMIRSDFFGTVTIQDMNII